MGNVFNIARAHDVDINKDIIINEAVYFGKTKEVLKVEKYCTELTDAAKNNNFSDATAVAIIRKLENAIAELVNCENVYLSLSKGTFATMPSYISISDNLFIEFFNNDRLITDRKGIKFQNSKGKNLYIFISPFHLKSLTGPEFTAIMLHEIGHNLEIQFGTVGVYAFVALINPFRVLSIFCRFEIFRQATVVINNNKSLKDLFASLGFLFSLPNLFLGLIMQLLSKIIPVRSLNNVFQVVQAVMKNPSVMLPRLALITVFNSILGYDGEKYSDAYATAYGYGPEIASGLEKLSMIEVDRKLNTIPMFKYFQFVNDLATEILHYILAPHPHRMDRIASNIQYMEQAKNEVEDPRLRAELEIEIKEMKDLVKDISEDKYEKIYDKLKAKKMINTDKYTSKDFRESISVYRGWSYGSLGKLTEEDKK